MNRDHEIAVLGAGPAGLTAAWVALRYGEVTIYSIKEPSRQYGAQYLHNPVPFANDEPHGTIKNYFTGTAQGYRDKIYGDDLSPEEVSWHTMPDSQPAWDLRRTYRWLWDRLEHLIVDTPVHEGLLFGATQRCDEVISSVPAHTICSAPNSHSFHSYQIGVTPVETVNDDNFVVYNGDPAEPWYRWSQVFGYGQVEWGYGQAPDDAVSVTKPYDTDCYCWHNIARVGRYGRWRKGVLVDHVIGDVDRLFTRDRA